jgi:hypothetical protein
MRRFALAVCGINRSSDIEIWGRGCRVVKPVIDDFSHENCRKPRQVSAYSLACISRIGTGTGVTQQKRKLIKTCSNLTSTYRS